MTVSGDERPLVHVGLFLDGWPLHEIKAAAASPDIEIEAAGEAFLLRTRGATEPTIAGADAMDAANALAGAAIGVHVARDPGLICLHGGAVRLPQGVVALVGNSGSGKSSVALMLSAAGHRLFGDDRVGLALPGEAMALGLAPKMRWPLPPGCDESFARYVEDRAAWWGEDAVYLRPRPGESANLGERAPLAAVVLLTRDDADETFGPLAAARAVRDLLPHCFAPHLNGARAVDALAAMARTVTVARLTFRDSTRAAARLAAAYG